MAKSCHICGEEVSTAATQVIIAQRRAYAHAECTMWMSCVLMEFDIYDRPIIQREEVLKALHQHKLRPSTL